MPLLFILPCSFQHEPPVKPVLFTLVAFFFFAKKPSVETLLCFPDSQPELSIPTPYRKVLGYSFFNLVGFPASKWRVCGGLSGFPLFVLTKEKEEGNPTSA